MMYEDWLEPTEPKVDGAWVCDCCEEVIPGDDYAYDINGKHYCEICMDSFRTTAPYAGEEY